MTYASEVAADSPWGYWKCDEASGTTLADSSGNGRSVTLSGSAAAYNQTELAPSLGGCLQLNGSCRGETPNIGSAFNNTPVTFEGIMQSSSIASPGGQGMFFNPNLAYYASFSDAGAALGSLQFGDDGSHRVATSDAVLTDGVPAHIMVVIPNDGTGTVVYVNGVAITSYNGSTVLNTGFGLYGTWLLFAHGAYFIGKVQHFAVYNHVVSAARVLAHAKAAGLVRVVSMPKDRLKHPVNLAALTRAVR